MPVPRDPDLERVLALMRSVAAQAASLGTTAPIEAKRHDLEIVALFDRCSSMHGAIYHLLDHGFAHEAVILGRPLFTDSLALSELAACDETERGSLVVGWELKSLQQLDGYFRELDRRGHDVVALREGLASRRAMVEKYADDLRLRKKGWTPDDHAKRLADKHRRGAQYTDMLVAHWFVHGGTTATSDRFAMNTEGVVEVGGTRRKELGREAGLFAADSLLHAIRATCSIFGWPESVELQRLFKAVETEVLAGKTDRP